MLRFSELQKALPGIDIKMLTKQLRCLERTASFCEPFIQRFRLMWCIGSQTSGKTLIPILEALCDWGADYLGIEEGQRVWGASRQKMNVAFVFRMPLP